ncbi:MAG: hypothetical protein M2R45_02004 [Verrucomicrobia subdivision 3 bacterium]|nr:hypothetical protein [Limisphaerales bacterium]MCS1414822.1 hypothetical protein [Limisphaerales bacterium]
MDFYDDVAFACRGDAVKTDDAGINIRTYRNRCLTFSLAFLWLLPRSDLRTFFGIN